MGWRHLFALTLLSCLVVLAKTLSTRLRLSKSRDHELPCLVPGSPGRELSFVPFTKKLALGLPHKSLSYWCVLLLFLVSLGFGALCFVRGLFCISWQNHVTSAHEHDTYRCVYMDHACIPGNKKFGHDILSFNVFLNSTCNDFIANICICFDPFSWLFPPWCELFSLGSALSSSPGLYLHSGH